MMKIFMVVFLGFQLLQSGGQQQQARANAEEELNLQAITEKLAQTSPEGLVVIERVKRMTPVMQKNRSARTLGAAVEECIRGQGQFVIYPLGWQALKSDGPRWRIFFYFKDEDQKYLRADWEYNTDKNVLLPVEFANATKFWVRRSENLNP